MRDDGPAIRRRLQDCQHDSRPLDGEHNTTLCRLGEAIPAIPMGRPEPAGRSADVGDLHWLRDAATAARQGLIAASSRRT
jgi:hypothetical protein